MPTENPTSPPQFQDSHNRQWTVRLSLSLADRVYESTQVDLLPDSNDLSAITALTSKYRKLGAVLWECCKAQADEQGVSRESFMESLDGSALASGWGALVDAIVFFIRQESPKKADAVAATIEKLMEAVEAEAEMMLSVVRSEKTQESLNRVVAESGEKMQSELTKALDSFAGSLAE